MSTATNLVPSSILTWIGVLGGAVTVFGNLDALISLAGWASWLVAHWKEWLRLFWVWTLGWLGIKPGAFLLFDLTFALFIVLTGLGSRIEAIYAGDDGQYRLTGPWLARSSASLACALAGYVAMSLALPYLEDRGIATSETLPYFRFISLWAILFLAVMHWPAIAAFGTATILEIFLILLYVGNQAEMDAEVEASLLISVAVIGVSGFLAFVLAVPERFHKRLWFMLCGFALLATLNMISQLGLDLRPPQLRG